MGFNRTMTLEMNPEEIGRCLSYVRKLIDLAADNYPESQEDFPE